jgi:hypothetical protein
MRRLLGQTSSQKACPLFLQHSSERRFQSWRHEYADHAPCLAFAAHPVAQQVPNRFLGSHVRCYSR